MTPTYNSTMLSVEQTATPLSFHNMLENGLSKPSPKSAEQLSNQSCKRYSVPRTTTIVPLAPIVVNQLHGIFDNRPSRPPPSAAVPLSIRSSTGAWTPSNDQILLAARAQGMNWVPIQQSYFPSKTPNACRKRHERLMERINGDDWDGIKLESFAKNYMSMRREIWSTLAAQTGEKWSVVEQKCMSQGLKNLQIASRSCALRERLLDPPDSRSSHSPVREKAHTDDSGHADEDNIEGVLEECLEDHDDSPTIGSTVVKRVGQPVTGMGIENIPKLPPSEQGRISEANERAALTATPISLDRQASPPPVIKVQPNFPGSNRLAGSLMSSSNTTSTAPPVGIVTNSGSQDTHKFQDGEPVGDHKAENNQTDPRSDESTTSGNDRESLMWSLSGALRATLLSTMMKAILTNWHGRHAPHFRECTKSTAVISGSAESQSLPPSLLNSSAATSLGSAGKESLKRGLQNGNNDDKQDENGRKRPRKEPNQALLKNDNLKRHPCPYRVHDSTLFRTKTGVDTCGGTWPDIAKLKEHLYRKHYVEFQCQRCKAGLTSMSELCHHAESDIACEPRPRQAKDGFTSGVKLLLLSKKRSFPNQDEEDKWKEIHQLLFPVTNMVTSSFSKQNNFKSQENQSSLENITLEEFGNLALPEEFRRRAVSLIAEAVRPLQDQLAKQVSGIVLDSQEAINVRYQQMLQTPGLFNVNPMDNLPNACGSQQVIPTVPELFMTTEYNHMDVNDYQLTSVCNNTFDLSMDPWTSLNQDEVPQPMYGASYSPFQFPSDVRCSCKFTPCICQPCKGSQVDTRESSSTEETLGSHDTERNIMSLLQDMQRSIATMEKKLSAVGSNTRV
ncbi:hypothetical protein BKA65DRAFT_547526 [Rhexocercosporidium sp. MPI-PUGE-AT-0058]|nr:hypothetical protein BKA65DRAFT_547526 [Rhexocercosporidium sp. MPI-PUGE-AT-0058]